MSARTSSAIQRQVKLSAAGRIFSHSEASHLFRRVRALRGAQQIVIDLSRADDATTSAFAQMVLLRRWLLRSGCDLRLTNLHSRAAGVFEVNRLHDVLPVA